jgi:uncharacterized surface protein with fasciclin (FAS1) repeats
MLLLPNKGFTPVTIFSPFFMAVAFASSYLTTKDGTMTSSNKESLSTFLS